MSKPNWRLHEQRSALVEGVLNRRGTSYSSLATAYIRSQRLIDRLYIHVVAVWPSTTLHAADDVFSLANGINLLLVGKQINSLAVDRYFSRPGFAQVLHVNAFKMPSFPGKLKDRRAAVTQSVWVAMLDAITNTGPTISRIENGAIRVRMILHAVVRPLVPLNRNRDLVVVD